MGNNDNLITSKYINYFKCSDCDFMCSKKGDWNRHILTQKHKMITMVTNGNLITSKKHHCKCGKSFMYTSGLSRHKSKCLNTSDTYETSDIIVEKNNTIDMLITQNKELIELLKNGINNNNTTNNINANIENKTFNLNFFLNNTCKDAMNIKDFVSSINVNLEDLENTGRQGYIQGISNIILKNLNNLEQHMRPLHCSNSKHETLYIKDNNEWTKETEDKPILTNAIKIIANKNIKQISTWRDNHLDCTNADSKKNNLYLKIVSNSMNDTTEEHGKKNMRKIISNVIKEVIIEK